MKPHDLPNRDVFLNLLGIRDEQINQLEQQLEHLRKSTELNAQEWQRLTRHRDELAEWIIDRVTNDSGQLIGSAIDAGLRGELFVPCSFSTSAYGRRFRMNLASTEYEVREILGNG